MNNKEYIAALSRRTGYSQDDTQRMVRSIVEAVAQKFDDDEGVEVPNFGSFELKKRMERIAVNPSTGKRMLVPPKIVITFKQSAEVKDKINNGDE